MAFETDTFLVREHVGMLKLQEAYDILSPDGRNIGLAKETTPGFYKILKLVVDKRILPFKIEISGDAGSVLLTMRRSFAFLRSKVFVSDQSGQDIGYFRQRLLSWGGAFDIFTPDGGKLAELKGDWKGWNFTFYDTAGQQLGVVSKKWAGLAKELFTSADNYVVHIEREKIQDVRHVQILLAAAVCIDMVLKESN